MERSSAPRAFPVANEDLALQVFVLEPTPIDALLEPIMTQMQWISEESTLDGPLESLPSLEFTAS